MVSRGTAGKEDGEKKRKEEKAHVCHFCSGLDKFSEAVKNKNKKKEVLDKSSFTC